MAAVDRYIRPAVRAMSAYAPGEQVNDCVKLNTNECAWGPSPAVRELLAAGDPDQLRLYPQPLADDPADDSRSGLQCFSRSDHGCQWF